MPRSTLRTPRGRRRLLLVGLAVAAAASVTACGSAAQITAKKAAVDSLTSLGTQSGMSVTVSLGLTTAQVSKLAILAGATIPTRAAAAISDAALVWSFRTGHGEAISSKQTARDSADSFDFGLRVGSAMPLELRSVGQSVYARIEFAQLQADFGHAPGKTAGIEAALQKLDRYVPGLAALGKGDWVSINKSSLQPLIALFEHFATTANGKAAAPAKAAADSLVGELHSAFNANTTYTNAGTIGGRTQYDVTIDLKNFAQQVAPALQSLLSALPLGAAEVSSSQIASAIAKLPATAKLQLFVAGGKPQEVDLDLNQFAPAGHKAPFPVPLRVVIAPAPSIVAPAGATPIDLSNLGQLLGGMMIGAGSS
jgi:hypothetical protein